MNEHLRNKVIEQIKEDVRYNDFEQLFQLLRYVPTGALNEFLLPIEVLKEA